MIIKMRKDVFHTGFFAWGLQRKNSWQRHKEDYLNAYDSTISDGKYVYFHLQGDEELNEYSCCASLDTYILHNGELYVRGFCDTHLEKWGDCEVVNPPQSTSWFDDLPDDTVVLLTTGEVCTLGIAKNRVYLKDGELVNDCNVAAVGGML